MVCRYAIVQNIIQHLTDVVFYVGDQVTAGTTNFDGTLIVQATAAGGDAAISNIINLVEAAQARTAPIQRLADVVAGKFAYAVMGAATLTFAFWLGIGSRAFPKVMSSYVTSGATQLTAALSLSMQLACNVLVVACPCALGLAAPTAVLVGTGAGARKGLLVRGGDVLETASKVDTIIFDKTGTLTTGKPTVVNFTPFEENYDSDACMALAAAVEENSSHPIAHAIVQAIAKTGKPERKHVVPGTFNQVPGRGAQGKVDDQHVYVGNWDWVRECTQGSDPNEATSERTIALPKKYTVDSNPGHTIVYVAIDGAIVGAIEIADTVREDAAHVLEKLKKLNIRTVMLSGDNEKTAKHVAHQLGISDNDVISDVTPTGKVEAVRELQAAGMHVAMVGDGVNDAAALAESQVGIAMGGGVAVASEVSDVVLLGDRLSQVLDILSLSRMTMTTIKQNMAWAFAYNMVCLPIAAGALLPTAGIGLTPAISGALMGCSSLAVMANSLLLQRRAAGIDDNSHR